MTSPTKVIDFVGEGHVLMRKVTHLVGKVIFVCWGGGGGKVMGRVKVTLPTHQKMTLPTNSSKIQVTIEGEVQGLGMKV